MTERDRCVAVLLAGGVGERVGLDIPKQLLKVAGRPIMHHTLEALHGHPDVDEIIVMMAPGHLDAVRDMLRSGAYPKVTQLLEGAASRNATTQRALDAVAGEDGRCKLLMHDAVRPLLGEDILTACVRGLDDYDAVDVAVESPDTIIELGDDGTISDIPPRHRLRRGQTPQGFRAAVIREAYERASQDPDFVATDDCSVVLRYLPDVRIGVVPGSDRNMKVTTPIDLYLVDKLFQLSSPQVPAPRTDEQSRRDLDDKVVVVFGGSYGIGADIAALAAGYGARVESFSRSTTDTHVERREDIARAAREVVARHGAVDHVVNCAGTLPRGALVDASEEEVYLATTVNYLAPVFIAQEFHPALRESRGSLLLFTSSSYTRGRSGYSLYSSAKAATVNLTQALADEWAADGIRVNCINPERTATPMRTAAFGVEPVGSLLDSAVVARASLDAMLQRGSGHVVDLRRADPLRPEQPA